MQTIEELTSLFPRTGRVEWIGIAAKRRGTIHQCEVVSVGMNTGIDGEHHATGGNSKRQVTLIQHEHLPVVASLMQIETVTPDMLRRNIVVSGINLLALKDRRFRIGTVELEGSGLCVPCSLMEAKLGVGGYNAMRGHGGITTVVVTAGEIRVGDEVVAVQ